MAKRNTGPGWAQPDSWPSACRTFGRLDKLSRQPELRKAALGVTDPETGVAPPGEREWDQAGHGPTQGAELS